MNLSGGFVRCKHGFERAETPTVPRRWAKWTSSRPNSKGVRRSFNAFRRRRQGSTSKSFCHPSLATESQLAIILITMEARLRS